MFESIWAMCLSTWAMLISTWAMCGSTWTMFGSTWTMFGSTWSMFINLMFFFINLNNAWINLDNVWINLNKVYINQNIWIFKKNTNISRINIQAMPDHPYIFSFSVTLNSEWVSNEAELTFAKSRGFYSAWLEYILSNKHNLTQWRGGGGIPPGPTKNSQHWELFLMPHENLSNLKIQFSPPPSINFYFSWKPCFLNETNWRRSCQDLPTIFGTLWIYK